LGETVSTALVVENPGSRRFRGQIRDAWAPSARAEPRTHAVDIAAGQRFRVDTLLRPMRRGDQESALVTARSVGPLGLAGRQSSHRVPWQVRILPPFLSRKHLPSRLAKLRELDGMIPVLIVLCGLFSFLTWSEQYPTGASAARQIARAASREDEAQTMGPPGVDRTKSHGRTLRFSSSSLPTRRPWWHQGQVRRSGANCCSSPPERIRGEGFSKTFQVERSNWATAGAGERFVRS